MSNTVPGGWSAWNFTLSAEAESVFQSALGGLLGVQYSPLAFATQVVAGTNYCYLCKGQPVYPGASQTVVELYVYQPLQGDPHITKITNVTP